MKVIIFFFIIFMSLSVNLTDSIIGRLGFDPNYILVACVATFSSIMIARRRIIVITMAACLAIVANMPEAAVSGYGIDRDHAAAILIALLITPYIIELLE